MVLVALLVATVGATFALAFGLGGREVARELSAGRDLRTAYQTGQVISFGSAGQDRIDRHRGHRAEHR
jgi:hypothetical protein